MKDRPTLSARAPKAMPADELLAAAIRSHTCVRAVYNRNAIRLAPHILYRRNDDLFVDGVVLERDGQPPREPKLGTFKLDGLKALASARVRFEPHSLFDPAADKYAPLEPVAQVGEADDRAAHRTSRQAG